MDEQTFKTRTKKFALRVIRLTEALPNTRTADVIGKQLVRSGTSVGANYRAACRAQSVGDMIAKLKNVEEEADESLYWMELLVEAGLTPLQAIQSGTLENAKFFRVENRLGSIEPGKQADLVLVEGDPSQDISNMRRVKRVMIDGAWLASQ